MTKEEQRGFLRGTFAPLMQHVTGVYATFARYGDVNNHTAGEHTIVQLLISESDFAAVSTVVAAVFFSVIQGSAAEAFRLRMTPYRQSDILKLMALEGKWEAIRAERVGSLPQIRRETGNEA